MPRFSELADADAFACFQQRQAFVAGYCSCCSYVKDIDGVSVLARVGVGG
jgi:hypothetical protein